MRIATLALITLLGVTRSASAETPPDGPTGQLWVVGLEGCQRTPATGTSASGRARVELVYATQAVTYSLTLTGVATPVTAIHLHGPAGRGVDGPIVMTLPTNDPIGGSFTPSTEVRGHLLAGDLYFDVHTTAFPEGELRGQIDDLGSACPPPVDAGLPDGPSPDGAAVDAAAGLDAAGADDKPEGCDGCATHDAPSLAAVAAVGALLVRRRRGQRR